MTPEPTGPGLKGASKRVSAQHTLERVRNNQRRHRARRREHIASLEAKVAEMAETISTLRGQVDRLQRQLARHGNDTSPPASPIERDSSSPEIGKGLLAGSEVRLGSPVIEAPTPPHSGPAIPTKTTSTPEEFDIGLVDDAAPLLPLSPTFSLVAPPDDTLPATGLTSISSPRDPPIELSAPTEHPSDTCCTKPTDESALYIDPVLALAPPLPAHPPSPTPPTAQSLDTQSPSTPCNVVQNLLPEYVLHPSMSHLYKDNADESTTLCSEAYVLISQQNVKGLGQDELAGWLWRGFRRALRPGEGCRVTTNALFGLLAYISDP